MWLVETDVSVKQRKDDFLKVGNLAVFVHILTESFEG